ncbi:adhesion G protein-coupled receptor E2-like [Gigantopelta aegis]|uniref:adhesion G protein-coupled receptor E2-like n=1 Tax=Gigantopelta aegis TaxID=1735272 RepID=UPI001B88E3EF|nr:adhesion G protein-coupled receptor E2-like [Gigantopelta aegis]
MYGYRVCFQTNITITNPLTSSLDLNELAENHFPRLNYRVIRVANVTSYVVEIQNCLHKMMYAVVRYIIFVYSLNFLNRDEFEQELMGDELILTNSSVHVQYQGGCNSRPTQPLTRGDEYHCSTQFVQFVFPKELPVEAYGMNIYQHARYIQLSKQIICPRVVLNSSKYIIHHRDSMSNGGENEISTFPVLTLLSTQTILKDGDFQDLGNGSVAICVSDYMNATSQASILCNNQHGVTSTFLGIFSFVCTSVSLLFLALTFLTYCLFVSMRTIGGMCNMGLVFTLFSAQIVLEFGMEQNQDVVGCQVIGIFIHFLWLAAVFWMNACTFLLFLKLSFPLKSRNFGHNVTKIFCLSALYANGTSALIVSLNTIVNIATRGDIGYGGNICYLNTYFSQIYFFKIPIGIIVIVNIGLFIFTVCRIRRNVSVSSTRESKINLFSCVKLSVITGLVWLSSYLYEIFHITAFAYIFTLLVGAQGVLFFVAVVVNRNVLSLWTSFFVRMKNGVFKGHKHSDRTTSSKNITRLSNISHSDSYELTIRRSKSRV